MKPELILHADILDIIFENRNKEYGAYRLRKDYAVRMRKSLSVAGALVVVCFIASVVKLSPGKEVPLTPETPDVILDRYKPPVVPPPPSTAIATVKSAAKDFQTPLIVNEPDVKPFAEVTELAKNIAIGNEDIEGPPAEQTQLPPSVGELPLKEPIAAEPVKENNKILDVSEVMPEFPGGQAAFIRFLSKNLRVPEDSMEPGQTIKIVVRFVVGKDGELSQFEFTKTNGEVFEQEVLRVLKKMPKWKPGLQNGGPVRVYFNLPVVFEVPVE